MSDERPAPPSGGVDDMGAEPLLYDDRSHDGPRPVRVALALAAALGAAGLAVLVVGLSGRAPTLPALVEARLGESGASNPVTGVLLGFRAYDTLLEVTVVLAAVVAVWSLDHGTPPRARDLSDRSPDPVLDGLARLVVPLTAVAAVYFAWSGGHTTGGGFQAGALMAGAGVLLAAGGYIPPFSAASRAVRLLAALGPAAFVAVGVGAMAATGSFLQYPRGWAHGLVLGLEAVIAVAVTASLVELFVDVPAVRASDPSLERVDPTGDPLGRILSRSALDPTG